MDALCVKTWATHVELGDPVTNNTIQRRVYARQRAIAKGRYSGIDIFSRIEKVIAKSDLELGPQIP